MKKNDTIAELKERRSKKGTVYFVGKLEGGAPIRMIKVKEHNQYGEAVWELSIDRNR